MTATAREITPRKTGVAGRHRLAAHKRNGETKIECVEETGGEEEATLWEIAENLHRKELEVQERADEIARWVTLLQKRISAAPAAEIKTPKTAKNVKGAGRKHGPVSKVAKALGVRRITRCVALLQKRVSEAPASDTPKVSKRGRVEFQ